MIAHNPLHGSGQAALPHPTFVELTRELGIVAGFLAQLGQKHAQSGQRLTGAVMQVAGNPPPVLILCMEQTPRQVAQGMLARSCRAIRS